LSMPGTDISRRTAHPYALQYAYTLSSSHGWALGYDVAVASGQALTDLCKRHLIETMQALPECGPTAAGLGQKALEEAAGFELSLPEYDGYFTWSLLVALTMDGKVEALQPGKRNKKYRLAR
jgi:hypothetical protein